jgi:hypothetical protein
MVYPEEGTNLSPDPLSCEGGARTGMMLAFESETADV